MSKREAVPGQAADIDVDSDIQIAKVIFLDGDRDLNAY